jgi:signal transduction histidine kinase
VQAIRDHGGITFADRSRDADLVLRPAAIARELGWIARHPLLSAARSREGAVRRAADVRATLRAAGRAFDARASRDGREAVERRIFRRMIVGRFTELAGYASYLRDHPEELAALANELVGGGAFEALTRRNLEAARPDQELQRLLDDLDLPLVVVDREMRLRRFTPSARRMVNVIPSDLGRPVTDIGWNIDGADVDRLARRALKTGKVAVHEVRDREGRRHTLSIRPDSHGKGAVIALADVDAVASARAQAERDVELHHAVTRTLIAAPTVAAAMTGALQLICQQTTWARGEFWAPNGATNTLEPVSAWRANDAVRAANAPASAAPPSIDRSLAQQIWHGGEVVWRHRPSKWRTTFGCRLDASQPVGVLMLFVQERRVRDEPFIARMERLCRHLAVWLACKSVERTLRTRAEEYRLLSGGLLDVQDDERRRLARELHDSAAQYLAVLIINLDHLEAPEPPMGAQWRDLIADIRKLANESAEKVRATAYLLHPPLLDEMGLASAVRWYAADFTERTGIAVEIEMPDMGRLDGRTERSLFRIVQESLTNVHRHSGSATVSVTLAVADGDVRLQIRDRGRGLRDAAVGGAATPRRAGVGIPAMRERVRQLSGSFEVKFTNHGTMVRVRIPLTAASP